MKISIVTISFNQRKYLKKCIDSILSQDYPNLEYIIVDPGSSDGSRELIESYGDKVIRVFEKDSGAADGLNKGFSMATGEILGFINSDDELLPGALKVIAESFQKHQGFDVISGCGYFTDSDGKRLKAIVPSKFTPWRYAMGVVSIFQQGTLFKRSAFLKTSGFNKENKTCWDGELFLDMALAGAKFMTIGSDIAIFRLHDGSITGSGRLNEIYQKERERLFLKSIGRPRKPLDRIYTVIAKIKKWLFEPSWLFRRLTHHC